MRDSNLAFPPPQIRNTTPKKSKTPKPGFQLANPSLSFSNINFFLSFPYSSLNNDCRSLIHYVKLHHGNVFRRVALSGMMESTKKLVKTQYKVEGNQIVR